MQFFKNTIFSKFSIALLAVIVVACNASNEPNNEEDGKENNLFISGEIGGAEGQTVYLEAASQNGVINVAQSVVKSNKFDLATNIPGLGVYQLRFGEQPENAIIITAKEGDKIKISGDLSTIALEAKISGVDWSQEYKEFMQLGAEFSKAQNELMALQGKVTQEELVKRYLELKKPMDDYARKQIDKNPSSPFNMVLSNSLMPLQGFIDYPEENIQILRKMADSYMEKYADSPITQSLNTQVLQLESGYKEYVEMKSGKKAAPDILLKSPEGVEIKLSSLKGKVVLIDFWASWCAPCRRENPNVVRLYNKYKNKGFTIYSVSLDTDKSSWVSAIEQDGLIWPNHVSDLTGWKSFVVKLYSFDAIPHTVLVGKDGNILDIGLRGKALEDRLAELLN
ncbi:MAG: AhpC/TSA family protein [Crocinitomicaceae bacterium]|nr:AhpC/TSA family protein [Crocinitomicaceae bacterium]